MTLKHRTSLLFTHLLLVNIAFAMANYTHLDTFWVDGWAYPSLFIVVNSSTALSFFISNQQKLETNTSYLELILSHFEWYFYCLFIILSYWFIVNSDKYFNTHISLFFILSFLFTLLNSFLFLKKMRNSEIINRTIKVGIIGNSNYSKALAKFFVDNKWTGFDLVYFEHEIDTNKITQINQLFINNVDYFIDENSYILLKDLSEVNLTKIKIFSPYFYNKFSNLSNKIGEFFFIELFEIPLNSNFNSLIKRLFDIFLTLTFLILVFWWLYILIAILIKINSNGPVFYKQKRNGIDGNVFECYKFRSMYQNNSNEFRQATKNDYRITRIGKILRKTNLDEIPQIINVLKGEMSIVGPRPHAVEHNSQFSDIIQKYNSRHKVKPGITGLAQVMGYRGETDTLEKMEGRVKYDRFYLYNWNFWLDIRIILLTIRNMILGDKNAY